MWQWHLWHSDILWLWQWLWLMMSCQFAQQRTSDCFKMSGYVMFAASQQMLSRYFWEIFVVRYIFSGAGRKSALATRGRMPLNRPNLLLGVVSHEIADDNGICMYTGSFFQSHSDASLIFIFALVALIMCTIIWSPSASLHSFPPPSRRCSCTPKWCSCRWRISCCHVTASRSYSDPSQYGEVRLSTAAASSFQIWCSQSPNLRSIRFKRANRCW